MSWVVELRWDVYFGDSALPGSYWCSPEKQRNHQLRWTAQRKRNTIRTALQVNLHLLRCPWFLCKEFVETFFLGAVLNKKPFMALTRVTWAWLAWLESILCLREGHLLPGSLWHSWDRGINCGLSVGEVHRQELQAKTVSAMAMSTICDDLWMCFVQIDQRYCSINLTSRGRSQRTSLVSLTPEKDTSTQRTRWRRWNSKLKIWTLTSFPHLKKWIWFEDAVMR